MRRPFVIPLLALTLAATPPPRAHPHVRVTPHVDPLYVAFLKRRDDRLAAWLPRVDDLLEPSKRHLSKLGPREDALLPVIQATSPLTRFWYDAPGPPSVWMQYDARHRIVRYTDECCGHEEEVLAEDVGMPPHRVAAADLRDVHTLHGVRLGMTQRQLERLYGPARRHRSTMRTRYDVLSYGHAFPARPDCGELQNFGFRRGRLVAIQVGRSC